MDINMIASMFEDLKKELKEIKDRIKKNASVEPQSKEVDTTCTVAE